MLPEQKELIFKHFPELVQGCDLEQILEKLIETGGVHKTVLDEVSLEHDKFHNNRRILFKIVQLNIFQEFVDVLRQEGFARLAGILENNPESTLNKNLHPLDVILDVKFSTEFYDTRQYNQTSYYSARSRNRGHVLIINNITFLGDNEERNGAIADEKNLQDLFEQMGFVTTIHRNLSATDMFLKTEEFAREVPEIPPDIGIVIVMSHGLIMQNEGMIVSSDNKLVPEDKFKTIFNNDNCVLYKKKPKIFIFHICRTVTSEPISQTMTDASLISHRTYSDMLICHPSLEGYSAHRNSVKGSWYLQMLCKVFMEHAHNMDVESLLKKVDEELEIVSSLPWKMDDLNHSTEQTSTFQNIAFKRCYLNPGIYEEDGNMVYFNTN